MNAIKPNLLFVMADQLRFDCIGAHGNPIVHTPNLDRFSAESADMQRYYANCPVCVPSRVSLFTGRYPHSHRIRENHTLPETGAEIHLFRILKQAGYRIGYTGKNHLLRNEEFLNFDFVDLEKNPWYHETDSPYHHAYTESEEACRCIERDSLARMDTQGAYAGIAAHNFPEELTEPGITTDAAIRFIANQQSSNNPFCLCVSWVQPHAPHVAPQSLLNLYDDRINVPEFEPCSIKAKANRYQVKYYAQRSDAATFEDKRRFIQAYYAMVTAIDRQFGRLMETLERLNMTDNTIVVFTSDHGEFLFENGLCKKDLVLTQPLLHVPLMIRLPSILAQAAYPGLMEEVDMLPTLLDIMKIEAPLGIQGKSVIPYIKGIAAVHKTAVYAEVCAPWQYNPYSSFQDMQNDWRIRFEKPAPLNVPGDFTKSISTLEYRYVWYSSGEEELYDLLKDPQERTNVVSFSQYRDTLQDMKLRLFEWAVRSEDPMDPKINEINQRKYNKWIIDKSNREDESGPYWLEQMQQQRP